MLSFFRCYIDNVNVKWDFNVTIDNTKYQLCGIVYYGAFHFIIRIITLDRSIWFNDSIKHGRTFNLEGNMRNVTGNFLSTVPDLRKCTIAVYVKDYE